MGAVFVVEGERGISHRFAQLRFEGHAFRGLWRQISQTGNYRILEGESHEGAKDALWDKTRSF